MPSALMTLDTGRPNFTGRETTEQKVEALNNYVIMLLENLRYILRNLGPENLNNAEMVQWLADNGGVIDAPMVITETLIADELYSNYGDIADLTVWKLRTDWLRVRNCVADVTTPINYIYIHDEIIEFITAQIPETGAVKVPFTRDGRSFWWTDETKTVMTSDHPTEWPVMVYQYEETVKARINFGEMGGYKYPMFLLGAGGEGREVQGLRWEQGRMVKDTESLRLEYVTDLGKLLGMTMGNEGYTDITGLRRTVALDFSGWSSGSFTETIEGSPVRTVDHNVILDSRGRPAQIDNCVITWPEDTEGGT